MIDATDPILTKPMTHAPHLLPARPPVDASVVIDMVNMVLAP